MAEMFLEDFAVGQVFSSARHVRVDKDEIIAFAKKYDPQFFHLDEEAARSSIFGGLVASGWLTAALTMRLLTEREAKPAGGSIGLGFDELSAGMVEPENYVTGLQLGRRIGQYVGRAAQKIEREAPRIAIVPGTALVAQVYRLDAKALRTFVEKREHQAPR